MKKRIISFMTALSMTLMIFTSMPTAATLAITTMDVTSFTASADTANGTHTFTNPDTFFYIDEENKFDYKEYCLTQAQIGKAINHPGAFVNSVASITVNYEASDDISGIIIAHSSDEANGWWAEESVSISQGSNSVTTAKPIKVDDGAVVFQIKTVNSDTNLINKTLKINSVTLTGVGYVSEKIDAANFTYSIFNNTSMEIGDSFTVSYNAANTPPAAKYSFKYKVPKSDGSGYDYYTPVLNNKVNGTDGQEATGLKVTSSTAGDITTYTFTAIAASAAEFELNIEVSASGTWSDTAFGGSSAYKVVDSTPAPTLTISPTRLTVPIGETAVITETVTNGYGYMYNETTSDANIVAIAKCSALINGVRTVTVRGVSAGTATITLKIVNPDGEDIAATCEVTVTAAECEHEWGTEWEYDEMNHWHVCTKCNAKGKIQNHSLVSIGNDTKPTCTNDGRESDWKCNVCAYLETGGAIKALGHSFTNYISNNDATCTADGTETAKCDRCGETETIADVGSALGHSFTNYISNNDATCTADGTETAKCDRCDETETIADIGSALGHSFTNYVSNNDATCTADGTKTATCDRCGETETTADVGSALGHSCVEHAAVPAACTADGNEAYWTCSGCDKMFADEDGTDEITAIPTVPALGHSFTNYVSNNDATCTADGTKTATCDRCGETETTADVGSALGHSCVEHAAVPADCTADGNEAYWTCSVCDKMFSDGDGENEITEIPTVPALGHSYVNGVCERCGEHENAPSPSYTVTPATATIKTGLSNGQIFTLEGYTADEQIDWDIDPAYAAKYVGSEFGLEHNQCKIVGTAAGGPVTLTAKSLGGNVLGTATITFTDETAPSHTHTAEEAWTSDATGHWHACSGCTEKVDFAAHTFDGGEETLPPTADNEGIMTYTCEICQYKETRSIPKLDPSPDTSGDKPEPPVTTSYVGGFSAPPAAETSDVPQTAEPPVSSPEEITDAPSTSPETAVQPPLSETTALPALPEQSGESSSAPDVINVGNISKEQISGENAPKAGLSDTAAELAEKVLNPKDIELINGGADMTIMLSVSDISDYISEEDKKSIEAALDTLPDYILGQYLDISLIKTVNGEQEIITEAKAPLTVTIDIPEAIRGADREYKIIRVHGGETVILDDIDGDPDTVTVKTDRFSSYAIVYRDKETKPGGTENNQNTGVESNMVFFAAAGITALSLLVLLHFTTGRNGISEAKKERLFRKLIAWGKKGGKLRSLTALALIWILLAFYYSIGMKTPQ